MEGAETNSAQKNNLFVRVAITRKLDLNSSPETSADISLLAVDVSESRTNESDTVELTLHIKRSINQKK